MGFFDKLFDVIESAKADAITDSKKTKPGCVSPYSLKEKAYQAYKNSSEETRKSWDENNAFQSNSYRERYEDEKNK